MQVVIDEKVPVFSFTFGALDEKWVEELKNNRTILMGAATTLSEARALEKNNIDMIVAQGSEAGGHRGTFLGSAESALIPLSYLVSQCVEKIKCPIIAAGGVMNGEKIAELLAVGVSGVQLGTAFLSCPESGVSAEYKQALMNLKHDQTTLTKAFSGKLARGVRNTFIERMDVNQERILDYPIQNALTRRLRDRAKERGATDFMSLWAGESAYLSRGVPAAELMRQLLDEVTSFAGCSREFSAKAK